MPFVTSPTRACSITASVHPTSCAREAPRLRRFLAFQTVSLARGVLLDVARARGVDWVDPPAAIGAEDLDAVAASLGVEVRRGDAVLLRSGQMRRRQALGPWDPDAAGVGLATSAMGWLAERQAAILGGDGDSDPHPSQVEGVPLPVHVLAIVAMGMCLLDNLDLENLSEACAEAGTFEFLLVVAPLIVPGGTGSPVNPDRGPVAVSSQSRPRRSRTAVLPVTLRPEPMAPPRSIMPASNPRTKRGGPSIVSSGEGSRPILERTSPLPTSMKAALSPAISWIDNGFGLGVGSQARTTPLRRPANVLERHHQDARQPLGGAPSPRAP